MYTVHYFHEFNGIESRKYQERRVSRGMLESELHCAMAAVDDYSGQQWITDMLAHGAPAASWHNGGFTIGYGYEVDLH